MNENNELYKNNKRFEESSPRKDSKLTSLKRLSVADEPFYFESDSLALRNNADYSCLIKTLVLLEGQRVRACNDIETLIDLKEEALKNPAEFVRQLAANKLSGRIPFRQKVYCLPEIDWDTYYECVDLSDFEALKNQNLQRVHSLRQSVKLIQQQESAPPEKTPTAGTRSSSRTSKQQQAKKDQEKEIKNYNKSWSVGEQRQLEELLLEFPPEDNEAARFRKIANKLGTRTPLQVQSHCQKYFIKLAKAGLPIPGRMPNLKTYVTKKGNRGNRRSSLMRGACSAAGLGSGRARLGAAGTSAISESMGRTMVGRGVSLNEISSMWTSFNPPITMNDDNELIDDEYENENEYDEDEEYDEQFENSDETLDEDSQENNEANNFQDEDSTNYSQLSANSSSNTNFNSNQGKTAFNFNKISRK